MQDKQQFEQLMLQYNQLKNSALEIRRMIENNDFDSAMTMLKIREPLFLNCKCIRKYLELSPDEKKEVDKIFKEIQILEEENIKYLSESMAEVQAELKLSIQTEKIQQAYEFNESQSGSIINLQD